jgi:hypothetical protein
MTVAVVAIGNLTAWAVPARPPLTLSLRELAEVWLVLALRTLEIGVAVQLVQVLDHASDKSRQNRTRKTRQDR